MGKSGPMERLAIERTSTWKHKEPADNLTRDVLAAEAAGMSYGQYKAQHPHTGSNPPPENDPGRYTITCPNCGKEIVVRTKAKRKYCSEFCRGQYQRRLEKEREEARKNGSISST